jgi:hypothetical protein
VTVIAFPRPDPTIPPGIMARAIELGVLEPCRVFDAEGKLVHAWKLSDGYRFDGERFGRAEKRS